MHGVAKQEPATLAKVIRHPVMRVIGRKPVHLLDLKLEVFDRTGRRRLSNRRIASYRPPYAHFVADDRMDNPRNRDQGLCGRGVSVAP
jgi:hypothetical protein